MAGPSDTYRAIWQAMHQRQRIVFDYNGRPRDGCPIILGYSEKGREAMKVFQIAGETSQGRLPDWRDFYLDGISGLRAKTGEWSEGKTHKQAQAFVKLVDVDVNIPNTLTRRAPLPFGHPDLRPPRTQP